jgi:hypothetical protein
MLISSIRSILTIDRLWPEPAFGASLLAFRQSHISQAEKKKKLKADKIRIKSIYVDRAASSITAEDMTFDKARRLSLETSTRCPVFDPNTSGGSIIHLAKIILRQTMPL